LRDKLRTDITAAVGTVDGVRDVEIDFGVMTPEQRKNLQTSLRGNAQEPVIPFAQPGSRTRVYAVASGKGGVGKSSVTVNLAAAIALQTHQRLVGVVENMSWLELPTGERLEVFGAGGGETVATSLSRAIGAPVPLLGQIPLDTRLREASDEGEPLVLRDPTSP